MEHREELISILSNVIKSETSQAWLEKLEGYKFPYGPVNDLSHAFNDLQVKRYKNKNTLQLFQKTVSVFVFLSGSTQSSCTTSRTLQDGWTCGKF